MVCPSIFTLHEKERRKEKKESFITQKISLSTKREKAVVPHKGWQCYAQSKYTGKMINAWDVWRNVPGQNFAINLVCDRWPSAGGIQEPPTSGSRCVIKHEGTGFNQLMYHQKEFPVSLGATNPKTIGTWGIQEPFTSVQRYQHLETPG